MLDQSDNNSPELLHNIRKLRQVWERHGKLIQREGTYPSVSETFYHALLQLVLLFGAEMWVLLAPCKHKQFYITQFHSGNILLYPWCLIISLTKLWWPPMIQLSELSRMINHSPLLPKHRSKAILYRMFYKVGQFPYLHSWFYLRGYFFLCQPTKCK